MNVQGYNSVELTCLSDFWSVLSVIKGSSGSNGTYQRLGSTVDKDKGIYYSHISLSYFTQQTYRGEENRDITAMTSK